MRRVFVSSIDQDTASIQGDKARHLARVVRIRPGELLEVSDGQRAFAGTVEASSASEVLVRLAGELPPPTPAPSIELLAAVIKFPRWETGLEKATEAGASTIVPVIAERTDGGLAKSARKRLERWQTIADEAAQQSRRLTPPDVLDPVGFREALGRPAALRVFLDFDGQPLPQLIAARPWRAAETLAVLVGPEGGWSDQERAQATEAGWLPASLGETTLRAETAAIVAVAFLRQLAHTGEDR